MKKFGRKLAIVLVMMMIFTSFEFVGVFADDTPEGEPIATEETGNGDVDVPAPVAASEEGSVEGSANEEAPSVEAPLRDGGVTPGDLEIKELVLLAGYNSMILRWKKIDLEGVDVKYNVYDYNDYTNNPDTCEPLEVNIGAYQYSDNPRLGLSGDYLQCKFWKDPSETTGNPGSKYVVKAVVGDVEGEAVESNNSAPVRTIAYQVIVKKGTTLKKHGGNGPSSYKLRKGQSLICYGFGGGGCYMFKHNGSIFYCAKIRTKKAKAIYTTGWNYSIEEAELYHRQRGVSTKGNVYLWCSQYTQHFYFMEKINGEWQCTDDWECSTGKPSSPSPTGMYGIKKIEGKWAKHHNIKWWSKFSGTNSVHGQKPKWTFGRPKSNGCVRNPVAKAYKVYRWAPVGTGLLMF